MQINFNNLNKANIIEKNNKNNTKLSNNLKESSRSTSTNNVAFYGLFNKKPIDATKVFSTIDMKEGQEYLIISNSVFILGKSVIPLNSKALSKSIYELKPNQKLYIGKKSLKLDKMDEDIADNHLCIRKNKDGQLFASALNKKYPTQILSNVVTPTSLNEPFNFETTKHYDLPVFSLLNVGGEHVDLGKYKKLLYSLQEGEKLIIGRSKNADIKIDDERVSRYHCLIEKINDRYYFRDLNSTNGTSFVKLSHPTMQDSDIITLKKGVPTKVDKDSQIYLGNNFAIDLRNKNILSLLNEKRRITIGRSKNCDFVVPDFYKQVSRKHLDLTLHNNEIYVTDLNSLNDTQIIPKNKIKPFYQGIENLELGQGNIGDCFLLVNLYALSRNPIGKAYLENMVKVDDEGNYVVNFYNKEPIVVPLEQLDGQRYGKTEKKCVSGEMGIRAIERAYAKMINNFADCGKTLFMDIDEGGKITKAFKDLTGIKMTTYNATFMYKDNVLKKLAEKPMKDYIMLCSTPSHADYGEYVDSQGRFINNHAYAIKNINAEKEMIEIVNPHDTKVSEWVSFCEFSEIFDYFHVVEM